MFFSTLLCLLVFAVSSVNCFTGLSVLIRVILVWFWLYDTELKTALSRIISLFVLSLAKEKITISMKILKVLNINIKILL